MTDRLRCFFAPSSVAIVGASDDPAKWGHIVAKQSLRNPARPTYFVNSRAATVLGRPTHPSLMAIGEPVDLAVVSVPVAAFSAVVDDAIDAGVRAVLAITAGFAELGTEGEALQRSCVERLRAAGIRLIGPNCLGLTDHHTGVHLAASEFAPGSVALLSQSGNLALELDVLFREAELGFSRFISLGNQADVDLIELMDSCIADPGTGMLALYVEDFRDGRGFIAAAQRAHAAGKPVVLLASGGGAAAQRSAGSHTGALSSDVDVVRMACALAGATFVRTPRELITALLSLQHRPLIAPQRIGIVTDGGGHGTIAAGLLEAAGFAVPVLEAGLQQSLRDRLWPPSSVANPVDLAGFGEQDPASYAGTTELLLEQLDAVLITGYFGGYSSPTPFASGLSEGEVEAASAIIGAARASGKPVVVHSMAETSQALDRLRHAGVPVFRFIEDAVAALQCMRPGSPTPLVPLPARPEVVFDRTASDGPQYAQLREYLRARGLPSAAVIAVDSEESLAAATQTLQAPYVLKTAALSHKSEGGGVVLDIADASALVVEYRDMTTRTGSVQCTVESMASTRGAVELLVGVRRDPRFGPVLTVGAGGVLAELLQDVVLACAPVTVEQARSMLLALRVASLLTGFRGRGPLDLDGAANTIAALSVIAAGNETWAEFEVNPLAVTQTGVHILDARVFAS